MHIIQIILFIFTLSFTNEFCNALGVKLNSNSESWKSDNTTLILDLKITSEILFYALCNGTITLTTITLQCHIYRWTFDNFPVTPEKSCMMIFTAVNRNFLNEHVVIHGSLHHMDDRTTVLHFRIENSENNTALVTLIDIPSCITIGKIYRDAYKDNNHTFVNNIVVHEDKTFDMFLSRILENGYHINQTRHNKNSEMTLGSWLVDLNNMVINEIGDNFFVRGYDRSDNSYKVIYNSKNQTKVLLKYKPDFKTTSWSGNKYYVTYHQNNLTIIQCVKFMDDIKITEKQNSKMEYSEAVSLIKAQAVGDNAIIIVSEYANCVDDKCWHLTLSMLRTDGPVETIKHHFNCSGKRSKLALYVSEVDENGVKIIYACGKNEESDNKLSHVTLESLEWKLGKVEF